MPREGFLYEFLKVIGHWFGIVLAGTPSGGLVGALLGGIAFKQASSVYPLSFGYEEGLGFGLISGFFWALCFGWIVPKDNLWIRLLAALFATFLAGIIPALFGQVVLTMQISLLTAIVSGVYISIR